MSPERSVTYVSERTTYEFWPLQSSPALEGTVIEQFEQFIKERQFISNVSPRTIEWYRQSLAWLDNPEPTQDQLKSLVIGMREHGLKPASCNNRIRALNAYLHWKTEGISKCG